jgi:hypothetical protein
MMHANKKEADNGKELDHSKKISFALPSMGNLPLNQIEEKETLYRNSRQNITD